MSNIDLNKTVVNALVKMNFTMHDIVELLQETSYTTELSIEIIKYYILLKKLGLHRNIAVPLNYIIRYKNLYITPAEAIRTCEVSAMRMINTELMQAVQVRESVG